MSWNTAFIHVIIVLVVLWFFISAKLLGAPRTLGTPGLCPAQLIGCDATVPAEGYISTASRQGLIVITIPIVAVVVVVVVFIPGVRFDS